MCLQSWSKDLQYVSRLYSDDVGTYRYNLNVQTLQTLKIDASKTPDNTFVVLVRDYLIIV